MQPDVSSNENRDAQLRQYLLGQMPSKSQQELEEQMMTDNRVFEELLLVEEELIDAYVREELTEHENERFQNHFLCTPERQRKLSFAATLREYVEATPAPTVPGLAEKRRLPVRSAVMEWFSDLLHVPSTALGASMAAALFLVVLGGVWLIVGHWRLRAQLDQVTADRVSLEQREQELQQQIAGDRSRSSALADELRRERGQRAALEEEVATLRAARRIGQGGAAPQGPVRVPAVPSFLLAPGLLRSMGDMQRVILPTETSLVRLQLDLGVDDYESYRAALHEAEGDEIWTQSKLESDTTDGRVVVSIILPVTLLRHGDYYFRLSGVSSSGDIELVGRYYFRVLEQ